jgi:hypothetical protein
VARRTVSDRVVDRLLAWGVDRVFVPKGDPDLAGALRQTWSQLAAPLFRR